MVIAEDSGKGISPEQLRLASEGRSGVGFRGMQERIRYLGGTLDIQSSGKGTSVKALLPIPEESASPAPEQRVF